jgi:hypothetical protein
VDDPSHVWAFVQVVPPVHVMPPLHVVVPAHVAYASTCVTCAGRMTSGELGRHARPCCCGPASVYSRNRALYAVSSNSGDCETVTAWAGSDARAHTSTPAIRQSLIFMVISFVNDHGLERKDKSRDVLQFWCFCEYASLLSLSFASGHQERGLGMVAADPRLLTPHCHP